MGGGSLPESKLKWKESWMNDLEVRVLLGEKNDVSFKKEFTGGY